MGRSCSIALLVVVAAGCKKEAPKEPRFDGPMPVSFGDCAGPTVAWVSGPRPQPFTPEEAEGMRVAAAEPPRRPDPDDGGQVASIARAEGHLATGQPERDRAPANPRLARQQARQEAIEQARTAGILGTIASEQGGGFASLTGTGDLGSGLDDNNIYGALVSSALEDANVYGSRLGSDAGERNGGFGFARSGFGPGGGTGWGTIGTIGHGSGTGRSGGYGRAGTVPTVSIGQPSTQGDLDKAIIRRYVKRNIQKITYCYEKQLLAKPTLAGTVAAQFYIAPTGRVASASAAGVDPDVATCVAGVIKAIEFPKPRGDGGVQVNYPFIFRPAGREGARSSSPPVQLASAPDRNAPDPAMAEAGANSQAAGAGSPPGGGPQVRALFRSPARGRVDARTYEPGASNPLRAEQHALTECFRKGGQRFGAVVLELRYDATGKVNDATAHGLDDEHARSCVLATAKRLQRTGAGPAAQRCALAFGVMPPAAMPAIDITADAIKLDGKQLASLPAAETDTHGVKIPELVAAIEAEVKAATAAGPALVMHQPRIIRPLPATPMNLVVRVLTSVLAAGDDLVLAAQRGTDWQLLQSLLTLPVVPVPFGTGGTWNHIKARRNLFASSASGDGERVTLSLLVTQDHIWVGLSRVNESQEVARGPSQLDKLAELLRAHKASAFFADRSDVEIAGDASVTYGDVVKVIDVALKTGFTGWQLTEPQGLTTSSSL
jgi:hypothetical protein